jgi:hypothetical protein
MAGTGNAERFHNIAQGLFAIAGICGIIAAAWLYVAERRDKPKIVLQPSATVVPLAEAASAGVATAPVRNALLQIRVTIENRSATGLLFNCPAIDLIALTGAEARAAQYPDDLQGTSLLARPAGELWENCVNRFEAERRAREEEELKQNVAGGRYVNPPRPGAVPRSGARFRDFFMEPGETTTKTWEAVVPCTFSAVRAIFKLPKPNSTQDYETKTLIPVADVCNEERNVSILKFEAQDDRAGLGGQRSAEAVR